jgi:hypothetical protein
LDKKIILWGFGSLIVLLLASVLIAPALIDSSFLKQKIQAGFIQQNIGEIDYHKSSLSLFPRPHLSVEKIRYFLPERVVGSVEQMTIYPELLPLFRGRIWFSKIVMDRPELTAIFSDEHEIKEDTVKAPVPFDLADSLVNAITPLTAYTSDLKVSVRQGDISVTRGRQEELLIKNVDLDAGLIVTAPRFFNTRLNIARALLTVTRGRQKTAIHCDGLGAALNVDKDQVRFTLSELNLAHPGMLVSGHFIAAPDTSGFILDLSGKELDVNAIRAAALDLGSDNEIVGDIFSYIKGGRIPEIRIQSKSKTISALGDLENIVIEGKMQNGEISVDDIGLQLAEVDGDVLVSKGLLEVFESNARLGETTGHDGSLKIGLAEDNYAFHLDVMLNARLQEVPSVLQNIIDHEAFIYELSLIRNLKGTGKARLVIGDRLDEIKTEIDILETDFSADYDRVPFPIKLSRGKLFIRENNVRAEVLHGSVGNSVFTGAFCDIGWENRLDVDISAGLLNLNLGELYPWISSFDIMQEDLADVKEVSGYLELSSLTLITPYDISDISDHWRLSAAGEVKKVAINTTWLPETLYLSSGHIRAAPNRLSFQKLNAQLMDAHGDLTGTIQGDISRPDHVEVSLNGELGENAIRFLTQSGRLPAVYAVYGPVKFADTDIKWQSADDFSFKGNIFFPQGAILFSDFIYQADGLQINRLHIQDQQSEATLALALQKNRMKLFFNGYLDNDTLDRIFIDEKMIGGWLKGDFEAVFVKGRLSESSLKGDLQGGNLVVPGTEGTPLVIDKFLFAAGNKGIDVNQLLLSYLENQVAINGRVDMTADAFLLDLDASAKELKWNFPSETHAEPATVVKNNSGIALWEYPVTGIINVAAESFSLGEYTWKPVNAQISRDQDRIKVEVLEANLCGIDTPGILHFDGDIMDLAFECTAKGRDIVATRECLSNNQVEMTGLFELTGEIKARGRIADLPGWVQGTFDFKARKGQITKDKKLSRVLEVVNFTEIVKGKIPDLNTEGFSYERIIIEGDFSGDVMVFNKLDMKGKTLNLLGKGTLDMKQMILDVELLAAPFKTVDSAIKVVPGINYLMAGNLISIPVRVRGDAADPVVRIMSASDISSNFLDFAERAIKSPIKLIENLDLYKKD